ncbi:MAG: hypothetical protein WD490_02480 [Opitutales bacterium]
MAFDRTSVEYHLTPSGWIRGTYAIIGKSDNEVPPPDDRIETWKRQMTQRSGWSKEVVNWSRTWRKPDVPEAEVAALRKEYPRPD